MTQEPHKSNRILIVIAIIGVIGTIIGATITVIGNYNVEKLRQETELTRIALVSLPISTSLPAKTDVPTMTLPPTLTPFPTVEISNPDGLLAEILSRGAIVIATNSDMQPNSFSNPNSQRPTDTKCAPNQLTSNELQGFDVDVSIQIGLRLGVEPCFVTPSYQVVEMGNWEDKWDIQVGSFWYKPERMKVLAFTTSYFNDQGQPAGITIDYSHTLPIKTLLATLNQIVDDMHKDGTLSALSIQWFGQDLTTK